MIKERVIEILQQSRPENIADLVKLIDPRSSKDMKRTRALVLDMVSDGTIPVKKVPNPSKIQRFLSKNRILDIIINKYARESIILSIAFLFFIIGISWFILLFLSENTSVFVTTTRVIFLGLDLLWAPGFSLTLMWYPYKSKELDFSKLEKKGSLNSHDANDKSNPIDFLTRIGYSVSYSIGLVILVGFLIGIMGRGFDVLIMKAIFSFIECYSVFIVFRDIIKLYDPYKVM
ncbi:MAG: hypothetical protein ACFFCS_28325 [Candidatus Hodarchaeota archaeon]